MNTKDHVVWLAITTEEKDRARNAAGKLPDGRAAIVWDGEAKLWYARPGCDLDKVSEWLPDRSVRVTGGDPQAELLDALTQAGLVLKGLPIMDGKAHRVPTVEDKKGGKRSGIYRAFDDRRPGAWFINYHTAGADNAGINWKASGGESDPVARMHIRAGARQASDDAERNQAASYIEKTNKAKRLFDFLGPASDSIGYAVRKGITLSPGLKETNSGSLVVPLFDVKGKFQTLQYIPATGAKVLYEGAPKQGSMHVVGGVLKDGDTILYAEGYATARSVNMALEVPVVMTVDAGNMATVADLLKEEYPNSKHLFLADFDHSSVDNKGLAMAKKAAERVGGDVVHPEFTDVELSQGKSFTDFNDLHLSRGLGAVFDQVAPNLQLPSKESHMAQSTVTNTESSELLNLPASLSGIKYQELVLIHATSYMPTINADGSMDIKSAFESAGGFSQVPDFKNNDDRYPQGVATRPSVHFTIQDPVRDHLYGTFEGREFTVYASMKSAIEKNGAPESLLAADTAFFSPDKPVNLPGALIVQLDLNGGLTPNEFAKQTPNGWLVATSITDENRPHAVALLTRAEMNNPGLGALETRDYLNTAENGSEPALQVSKALALNDLNAPTISKALGIRQSYNIGMDGWASHQDLELFKKSLPISEEEKKHIAVGRHDRTAGDNVNTWFRRSNTEGLGEVSAVGNRAIADFAKQVVESGLHGEMRKNEILSLLASQGYAVKDDFGRSEYGLVATVFDGKAPVYVDAKLGLVEHQEVHAAVASASPEQLQAIHQHLVGRGLDTDSAKPGDQKLSTLLGVSAMPSQIPPLSGSADAAPPLGANALSQTQSGESVTGTIAEAVKEPVKADTDKPAQPTEPKQADEKPAARKRSTKSAADKSKAVTAEGPDAPEASKTSVNKVAAKSPAKPAKPKAPKAKAVQQKAAALTTTVEPPEPNLKQVAAAESDSQRPANADPLPGAAGATPSLASDGYPPSNSGPTGEMRKNEILYLLATQSYKVTDDLGRSDWGLVATVFDGKAPVYEDARLGRVDQREVQAALSSASPVQLQAIQQNLIGRGLDTDSANPGDQKLGTLLGISAVSAQTPLFDSGPTGEMRKNEILYLLASQSYKVTDDLGRSDWGLVATVFDGKATAYEDAKLGRVDQREVQAALSSASPVQLQAIQQNLIGRGLDTDSANPGDQKLGTLLGISAVPGQMPPQPGLGGAAPSLGAETFPPFDSDRHREIRQNEILYLLASQSYKVADDLGRSDWGLVATVFDGKAPAYEDAKLGLIGLRDVQDALSSASPVQLQAIQQNLIGRGLDTDSANPGDQKLGTLLGISTVPGQIPPQPGLAGAAPSLGSEAFPPFDSDRHRDIRQNEILYLLATQSYKVTDDLGRSDWGLVATVFDGKAPAYEDAKLGLIDQREVQAALSSASPVQLHAIQQNLIGRGLDTDSANPGDQKLSTLLGITAVPAQMPPLPGSAGAAPSLGADVPPPFVTPASQTQSGEPFTGTTAEAVKEPVKADTDKPAKPTEPIKAEGKQVAAEDSGAQRAAIADLGAPSAGDKVAQPVAKLQAADIAPQASATSNGLAGAWSTVKSMFGSNKQDHKAAEKVDPRIGPVVVNNAAEEPGSSNARMSGTEAATPAADKTEQTMTQAPEVDGIWVGPRIPRGSDTASGFRDIDKDVLISRLSWETRDDKSILYKLDGDPAFVDRGSRLEMAPGSSQNDEKVMAALLTAARFYSGRIELTGSDEFKAKAIDMIAKHEIQVTMKNPAQQAQLDDARRAMLVAQKVPDAFTGDELGQKLSTAKSAAADAGAIPGPVVTTRDVAVQPVQTSSTQVGLVQPATADPAVATAVSAGSTRPLEESARKAVDMDVTAPRIDPSIHQHHSAAEKGVTGKIMDFGKAAYRWEEGNSESFYLTLKSRTNTETYWGKELAAVIRDTGANTGDIVSLNWLGKQPAVIQVPVNDKDGKVTGYEPKDVHINKWHLDVVQHAAVRATADDGVKVMAFDANRFAQIQELMSRQLTVSAPPVPERPHDGLFWVTAEGKGSSRSGDSLTANRPQELKEVGQPVLTAWGKDGQLDLALVRSDGDYLQGVVRHNGDLMNVLVSLPGQEGTPRMVINAVTDLGLVPIGTGNAINRVKGEAVSREYVGFKLDGDTGSRVAKLDDPASLPPTLHSRLGFDERWRDDNALPKSAPAAAPAAPHSVHQPG